MPLAFFTVPSETLQHLLQASGEEALSKRQKLKKSALVILQEYASKIASGASLELSLQEVAGIPHEKTALIVKEVEMA